MARLHDDQEDWESVARKFGVGVQELIYFNFFTHESDEVNWCLKRNVGCDKVSPSGNNWMFSHTAKPGIIWIPPAEDESFDFDSVRSCSWMPSNIQKFLMSLGTISRTMPGIRGQRIKKLVQVILRAGHPGCLDLWYYNEMCVRVYVDFLTLDPKRREMTKATQGAFPFDGDSGLYQQSGSMEQRSGKWKIHPVRDLFADFACGAWSVDNITTYLERIEADIQLGKYEMELAQAKTGMGGGDAVSPLVSDFINSVSFLAKDDSHLYSAWG